MKPDYKNWMPKGMVLSGFAATAVFLILFIVFGLTEIVPGQMYKIQTRREMNFNIVGTPIDVTTTSQTIHHGYNWIGTLSSEVMSPEEAFADLNPEKDDLVKNRSGSSICWICFSPVCLSWKWKGKNTSITNFPRLRSR